jgi:hypothetical protein
MKRFLLPLVLVLVAQLSFGQGGFFKPIPLPGANQKLALAASSNPTQYMIRPVASVTAISGNGAQLAGGFGIALQANQYDANTNTYITEWSAALLGFLATNGSKLSGVAGLAIGIPGTNGVIQAGPAYDFTNNTWGVLSGVQFKFN